MNQAAPLQLQLQLQHPEPSHPHAHANHPSPRGDSRTQTPHTQQTPRSRHSPSAPLARVDITVPPSALTATTAYDPHCDSPSLLDDYPHTRPLQRNLTGTFIDNLTSTIQQHTSAASFRSPSPAKSLASFIPSRSTLESTASQPKIKALQNWFNSSGKRRDDESASGSDYDSESEPDTGSDYDSDDHNMNIFNRKTPNLPTVPESPVRTRTAPATPKPQTQSTANSRFSWLLSTQKNSPAPLSVPSKPPTYHNPDDELINLNISQALFPHGPADPLAPSSFNDLLANAEALLTRYQKSYRELSTALVDVQSEQSAQDDELDEVETRARHLKMQLETMAARAAEQDESMRALMEDLVFERRARQEEEESRARSIEALHNHTECTEAHHRRNRISNSQASVDSGFDESECDTDAASVFSRTCFSPTGTDRSSILEAEPETPKARAPQTLQRGYGSANANANSNPNPAAANEKPRAPVDLQAGGWGCSNCEGGRQAAVWGRLAKEREENSSLRQRVETLEGAVESALDLVGGGSWNA